MNNIRLASWSDVGILTSLRKLITNAYLRYVRSLIPGEEHVLYAGLQTPLMRKKLESRFPLVRPRRFSDQPGYEEALVNALRRTVQVGDTVVVVGGGIGVTVAIAALVSGTGNVLCYEGDAAGVRLVKDTARLNGLSDRISVTHAVVGEAIAVYGSDIAELLIPAADLPSCDVLELDCEGAEFNILTAMNIRPRAIIVETHGVYGAPTENIAAIMRRIGYDVEDFGWAESRHAEFCRQRDIRVLCGLKKAVVDE